MGASVLALRVFGVDELKFPCKKCEAVRKWSDMRDDRRLCKDCFNAERRERSRE